MSDSITIARPYAKAIFEYALHAQKLKEWSAILLNLSHIILNEQGSQFISNPAVTEEQQVQFVTEILGKSAGKESDSLKNLITVLAYNKRLSLLPEINVLFDALRAEHEKTIAVQVISFTDLNSAQKNELSKTLAHRLKREVALEIKIDKSLLGGAIIQAGDLVIDGSVRGKIEQLRADVAA